MADRNMTKTQLVAALAEAAGIEKAAANRTLEALASIITVEVENGGSVSLPGIGKIVCRSRPERVVRNPATRAEITKPADRAVKVVIAKALKESVNKG